MQKRKAYQRPVEILVYKTLALYPYAFKWDNHFLPKQIGQYRPDWCYSPLADTMAMLTEEANASETPVIFLERAGPTELILLTAALSWTYTKEIYLFDATLLAELLGKPLSRDFSIDELLQLPEPCIYIEAPITIGTKSALGFFVWMEYDANGVQRKLADLLLVFHMTDGSLVSRIISLSCVQDQSTDSKSALAKPGKHNMMSTANTEKMIVNGMEPLPKELDGAINLVLYLCSEQSDIYDINLPDHMDGDGARVQGLTHVLKVGFRIGNTIRKHTNKALEHFEMEGNDHTYIRPYMRRAHWHSYWLGPKGTNTHRLVVRWMPSILVGAAWEKELPVVAWLAQ